VIIIYSDIIVKPTRVGQMPDLPTQSGRSPSEADVQKDSKVT
jgi:hypothetical protein